MVEGNIINKSAKMCSFGVHPTLQSVTVSKCSLRSWNLNWCNEMEIGSQGTINYNIKPTLIKAIIKKDTISSKE